MASIVPDKKTGSRMIKFMLDKNQRKTVWLGKMPKRTAETWKVHIEELASAIRQNRSPYPETSDWVSRLTDEYHERLSRAGLVVARVSRVSQGNQVPTLGKFLEGYISKRSDVKGSTSVVYGHTKRCLIKYFGPDTSLDRITASKAKDWRRWLGLSTKKGGQGLADNTVRRRTGIARQFFTDAVDDKLIIENPFSKVKGVAVKENHSRDYFVSREDIEKVIALCPNNEWKLIVSLARYLGIRIPSELDELCWGDIDFENSRITVRAPKTSHHGEGHAERIIPLFGDCNLRDYLQVQRNELLDSFDPKANRLSEQPVIRTHRRRENLRTGFARLIRKAGLKPWPKLFANCRSTRETELLDLGFKPKAVAEWMGHSLKIQAKHYVQVTEADYAKAIGFNCQISVQSTAVPSRAATTPAVKEADSSVSLGIPLVENGRHWTRNRPKNKCKIASASQRCKIRCKCGGWRRWAACRIFFTS